MRNSPFESRYICVCQTCFFNPLQQMQSAVIAPCHAFHCIRSPVRRTIINNKYSGIFGDMLKNLWQQFRNIGNFVVRRNDYKQFHVYITSIEVYRTITFFGSNLIAKYANRSMMLLWALRKT